MINLIIFHFIATLVGVTICQQNFKSEDFSKVSNDLDLPNKCYNEKTQIWEKYLEASSIIFGLSKTAKSNSVNMQCFKDLKTLENGILCQESWAMKVLDASGQKESGFIWGNDYWLGSKLGCAATQDPLNIALSDQVERKMKNDLITQMSPFKTSYQVVYLKHNSPWQVEVKFITEEIIHIGLCLPTSCDSSDIKNLTQILMSSTKIQDNQIFKLDPEVLYVKDLKLKDSFFENKSYIISTRCVYFTLLMTFLAWLLRRQTSNNISKVVSFIKCFDIQKNTRELFTLTESSPKSIPVIHGLRSVCCNWIMVGHILIYTYFAQKNNSFAIAYAEKPRFQVVRAFVVMVDVFFTISGFLQTYNFLKNENKVEKIRQSTFLQNAGAFGMSVFHRYLRLAPLKLCLMAIIATFTSYIEDVSVFHISDRFDQTCSKYWWRNVFFIQNFFHFSDMCLSWTWSLACEMQFFCLMTVLLFLYTKYPRIVKITVICGLMASITFTFFVGIKHQYQFSFDVELRTLDEIYTNPFIRIVPYLIGSITGWFLAQNKGNIKINSKMEKCIWNIAGVLFIGCVYSRLKRDIPPFQTVLMLLGSRLFIAMIVCWMIVGSATGRGTWWSRILESKVFQNTSRLSYAIYLVNPFVIILFASLSHSSTNIDPIQISVVGCGLGVLTYCTSLIFSLAFEIPFIIFSSLLLKKNLKKN